MPSSSSFALPSPAQLALALVVIKSKALETSLDDHISQLRQCILSKRRLSVKSIDGCAFWKRAYEKSEATQSDLLDRNYELSLQIEQLRNGPRRPKVVGTQSGVKRKRDVKPPLEIPSIENKSTSMNTKRLGKKGGCELAAETRLDIETNSRIEGLPRKFSRTLCELRKSLSLKNSSAYALASSLKDMCSAVEMMISESIDSSLRMKSASSIEGVQAAFQVLITMPHALRVCFSDVLRVLGKLPEEGGVGITQEAVTTTVLLFQSLLSHLHTVAVTELESTIKEKKSIGRTRSDFPKPRPLSVSDIHGIGIALTKAAIHVFEGVDLSQPSHSKILEGITCIFLDHLGSSLSLVVFADLDVGPKPDKTHKFGLLPPNGLLHTSDLDNDSAVKTARQEACYLVAILRQLMLCIERQRISLGFESFSIFGPMHTAGTADSDLITRVRKRLQDTLLRGIFGDDDELFKDALSRPVENTTNMEADIGNQTREDPEEWFIGEVWSLLGWSTLTAEGET